jgi:hypothetical protein
MYLDSSNIKKKCNTPEVEIISFQSTVKQQHYFNDLYLNGSQLELMSLFNPKNDIRIKTPPIRIPN